MCPIIFTHLRRTLSPVSGKISTSLSHPDASPDFFSFELEGIQNVLCDGRSTHFGTFYVFGAIRTPMATLWSSQHNFGEEMRLFCVSVGDEVTIKCLSNSWSNVFSWSSRRSSRRSVQTSAAAFLCEDTGLDWLLRKWFQAVFRARLQRLIFKTENPFFNKVLSSCIFKHY